MDVSQHGREPEYKKRFGDVCQQIRAWRDAYPSLEINIRKSHRGWRQHYRMVDGKLAFDAARFHDSRHPHCLDIGIARIAQSSSNGAGLEIPKDSLEPKHGL